MTRDLVELAAEARRNLPPDLIWRAYGIGGAEPPRRGAVREALRERQVLGALPVQLVGDDAWQPLPVRNSLADEWRLVLQVRGGWLHPARVPGVECQLGIPQPGQAAKLRGYSAVWGPDLFDLVAVPLPGSRDRLRVLRGDAVALGDPEGTAADDGEPVAVARNAGDWLRQAIAGAVLPLPPRERAVSYLRGLQGGIVAADLQHGLALEKLLRQPVPPLPRLMVRNAGEKAA